MTLGWNNRAYGVLGGAITPPPGASVPFVITAPSSLPDLVAGDLMTPIQFTSSGGVGVKTWTCTTGLPAGLSFSTAGVLSGTPTATGTTTETFRVTDSTLVFTERPLTIHRVAEVTTGLTWPRQDIAKGWGMTLNGAWEAGATTLYDALVSDPDLDENEWQWARIEVRGDTFEPTPGVYKPLAGEVGDKVAWCRARGIRPILDYTYLPWFRTKSYTYTGCTVTNVGGTARISQVDIGEGSWDGGPGVIVRCPGTLPDGTAVLTQGAAGGVSYVQCNKAATTTGGGRTVIFGSYQSGGTLYSSDITRHIGPADDTARRACANACAALVDFYRTDDVDTEVVLELWNEANGQFWRPRQNHQEYNQFLRYVYRAVKECNPLVAVAFTGTSVSSNSTNVNGHSYDAPEFIDVSLVYQQADTTWTTWTGLTTVDTSNWPKSKPANNLARLLADELIDADFYHDLGGFHAYGFGRQGDSEGAFNYETWLSTAIWSPQTKFTQILNSCYTRDPRPAKDGVNKMLFLSTETGCPWHPLAVTGRGFTSGGAGRTSAPVSNIKCASSEEAYAHIRIMKEMAKGVRNYPTGGSIPTKLFAGNQSQRWAVVIVQKLMETAGAGFSGAASFRFQGQITDGAYPGPPAIGDNVLKRAIAADRPRPYLNSGIYSAANIGNATSGADGIDAFGMVVD